MTLTTLRTLSSSVSPLTRIKPTRRRPLHSIRFTGTSHRPAKMVLHGQISGIELPATDVVRAAKFYTDTFGWKFQAPSAGIPPTKMQTFTAPGDIFPDEGVVSKVEEIPSSGAPKFYINVEDLAAATDVIVQNGGTKLGEVVSLGPQVPPFQFFKDTEGNSNAICSRPGK